MLEIFSYFIVLLYRSYDSNIILNYDVNESELINEEQKEESKLIYEYAPYLNYRGSNYQGKHLNVINNTRRTINYCSSNQSVTIWMFGGSAVWGSKLPDEYTLPSRLSYQLCNMNYSVNIVNFGEQGYVTTQEVLRYVFELRKNNPPDIVLFYDGFNDIFSTWQNKESGLSQNNFKRKLEFNTYDTNDWINIFRNSNSVKLIKYLTKSLNTLDVAKEENMNKLTKDIVDNYVQNYRFSKVLSDENRIKFYYFFQPSVFSKTPLTEKESSYVKTGTNFLLNEKQYKLIINSIGEKINSDDFVDTGEIFYGINKTIFLDIVHPGKEGNEFVAKFIFTKIRKNLKK